MCANNLDTYSPEAQEVESYFNTASPNKLKNHNSNLRYSVCNTFKILRSLVVSHNTNHQ